MTCEKYPFNYIKMSKLSSNIKTRLETKKAEKNIEKKFCQWTSLLVTVRGNIFFFVWVWSYSFPSEEYNLLDLPCHKLYLPVDAKISKILKKMLPTQTQLLIRQVPWGPSLLNREKRDIISRTTFSSVLLFYVVLKKVFNIENSCCVMGAVRERRHHLRGLRYVWQWHLLRGVTRGKKVWQTSFTDNPLLLLVIVLMWDLWHYSFTP